MKKELTVGITKLTFAILLLIGSSLGSSFLGCLSQPEGTRAIPQQLAEGITLLKQGHPEKADSRLREIPSNSPLSAWAILFRGKSAEARSLEDEALDLYRDVSAASAASTEARIGEVRIQILRSKTPQTDAPALLEQLHTLESEIRLLSRNDLLPELHYLRGQICEKSGNTTQAEKEYLAVRKIDPLGARTASARESIYRLRQGRANVSQEEENLGRIREAEQLVKDGELVQALQQTQTVRANSLKNSPIYFRALLLEEQIVRGQGRTEEANQLLALVTKEGDVVSSEQALKKEIRNAWNKNLAERALSLLHHYRRKFAPNPLPDEILMIEARTLEDLSRFGDAREIYLQLGKSASTPEKLKALRMLAWMHYRRREFLLSAEAFRLGLSAAEAAISESVPRDRVTEALGQAAPLSVEVPRPTNLLRLLRDLHDERDHHRYWLAVVVNKLDSASRKKLSFDPPEPEHLWTSLLEGSGSSYYALLASQALSRPLPLPTENRPDCDPTTPTALQHILEALASSSLPELAEHEIDFALSRARDTWLGSYEAVSGNKSFRFEELSLALHRIALHQRYGRNFRGLALADSLFKRPTALRDDSLMACPVSLRRLAFPNPFSVLYHSASQNSGVTKSLLLAVSRTESFFRPDAQSPKDARGLMQLLPSTARAEGMGPQENLFEPAVNIPLGAKHLGGLIKKYGGLEPFAIAAYNAGSSAVDRWRAQFGEGDVQAWIEQITYPETRDYVKKVLLAKYFYEQS